MSGSVYNSTHSLERKSSWMGRSSEEDMVVIVSSGCVAVVCLSLLCKKCVVCHLAQHLVAGRGDLPTVGCTVGINMYYSAPADTTRTQKIL